MNRRISNNESRTAEVEVGIQESEIKKSGFRSQASDDLLINPGFRIQNLELCKLPAPHSPLLSVLSFLSLTFLLILGDKAVAERPVFSFGVFTDAQHCDCEPKGTRHYRSSLGKLREIVRDYNRRELAFAVQLGDLIDRDMASFDTTVSILRGLKAPLYHVLGNHDYEVKDEEKARVLKDRGLRRGYYEFKRDNWRFLVLDGNDLSYHAQPGSSGPDRETQELFEHIERSGEAQARKWNGGLGREQLTWLEAKLKEADGAGERVILFCHYPVYPPGRYNLWNAEEVVKIIEDHGCVSGYLCGHNHEGNYAVKNGVHYLTLKAVLETERENAFSLVDVYDGHLNILGFGREPSRILRISAGDTAAKKRIGTDWIWLPAGILALLFIAFWAGGG
ncbi:metallophosphoesterase [Fibrobacterota bacterium]